MARASYDASVLPDGRRLGLHLPLASGMVKAADRAGAIGATALQVFTDNPTAWKRRESPPDELPAFRARLAELDIAPLVIHASYLVNVAGADADLVERSTVLLIEELRAAPSFGARFVNVHVGSHRDTSVASGTARLADAVARAMAETDAGPDAPFLVLENSAGSGFGLGTNVAELAGIADAVAARGVPAERLGFCIDTAHAWGAGIDLGTPEAVDTFLDEVRAAIGIDRIAMIHLNDSKMELGSRVDRHEHLGAGQIGVAGLARLLTHPALEHVTYILETPGMDEGYDAINLRRAWDIAAGRPLETLPPEAMTLSGSRTGPPEPVEA
jgi:deoxyribonuclease IV